MTLAPYVPVNNTLDKKRKAAKVFTLQSKGGAGKTHFNILMFWYATNHPEKKFAFLDCDDTTKTFYHFLTSNRSIKPKNILLGQYSLYNPNDESIDKKIDRFRFMALLQQCNKFEQDGIDYIFVDFGGGSSLSYANLMKSFSKDGAIKLYEKSNFIPCVVLTGDTAQDPSYAFYKDLDECTKQYAKLLYNSSADTDAHNLKTQRDLLKKDSIEKKLHLIPNKNALDKETCRLLDAMLCKGLSFESIKAKFVKDYGEVFFDSGLGNELLKYIAEIDQLFEEIARL